MKTLFALCICCILAIGVLMATTRIGKNKDNIKISVSESRWNFEFKADYNSDKFVKIEQCLDDNLKGPRDPSFKNTQLDATLTLSDHAVFYIRSEAGELHIKLDKQQNSKETLAKFRKLYAALKNVIGEK